MIDNPIKVRLSIIYNTWREGGGGGGYNSRTRLATYETRRQRVKTLIAFFTDVERSKDALFFFFPFFSFFFFFFYFFFVFFFFIAWNGCVEREQGDNAVTDSSSPRSISRISRRFSIIFLTSARPSFSPPRSILTLLVPIPDLGWNERAFPILIPQRCPPPPPPLRSLHGQTRSRVGAKNFPPPVLDLISLRVGEV